MKKRKLFISILTGLCACLMSATLLTACKDDHTHSYTEQTVNATCTEKGVTIYTCDCGNVYTEELSALGHDYIPHEAQTPTCTEIGWNAYNTCSRCNYTEYEEINALTHDEKMHETQAPTCTEIGWNEYVTCEREGCEYSTYEEIPATGNHTWNNGEITTEPTCTGKGVKTFTCTVCQTATYTEDVPALDHDKVQHNAQAATCTEKGWEAYETCTRCSYTTYAELPALTHDKVQHNAQTATCTQKGWAAYETCARCNYTTYAEIPAMGNHTWNDGEITTEPTCTGKGVKTFTCTVCGTATYMEDVSTLEHDYSDEWKYDENGHWHECGCGAKDGETGHDAGAAATETTDQKCTVCDYIITPALGHVHTLHLAKVDAKAQSCTEEGNIEYYTCDCGKWFTNSTATTEIVDKASVVIEKDKHNYNILRYNEIEHWYECTCSDKDGIENHKGGNATCVDKPICAICKIEYGKTNGHDYGKVVTAPTCTAKGYTTYTCHCGDSYVANEVEALGHKYGTVVTKPDCVNSGYTTYTCFVCDDTYRAEDVAALGHTVVIDAAIAPTCTETGLTEGKHCLVCGEALVAQMVVDALGHTSGEVVVENNIVSDCVNTGSYDNVVYCDDCHAELSRETITVDALGHAFANYTSNNNASCTVDGTETAKCDRCDETDMRTDVDSALGHSYNAVVTAPTCTTKGYTTYTCRCGNTYVADEVAMIAHIGGIATCTELAVCSVCGANYGELEDHNYATLKNSNTQHWYECTCGDKKNIANHYGGVATCKDKPICTLCNVSYGEANGHTEVTDQAVAPTCTQAGLTEGKHCSVCDEVLTVQEAVNALGHDYDVEIYETTTCEKASVTSTCKHCGAVESIIVEYITIDVGLLSESFNSLGSDDYGYYEKLFSINTRGGYGTKLYKYELFSSSTATKPQKTVDFTEDNTVKLSFTGYGSTLANYYYRVTVKDEVGNLSVYTFDVSLESVVEIQVGTNADHTLGNWIVDLQPTCTELGGKYQECSVCHIVLTRGTIDATGHAEGDWIIDLEPTCTEVGVKHKECVVCKELLLTSDISPLGHVEGEWIIDLEPTCEENGSKHKICAVCNQFLIAEIIDPHNFEDGFCKDCGAEFYTNGLQFELSSDEASYVVVGYIGTYANITIPNEYNSKPVVKIESKAFYDCYLLESIKIPSSVICMGENAFYGCNNLSSIYITSILDWCNISGIDALMNNGASQKSLYLDDVLISELIIPSDVTNISSFAFCNCNSLTSVVVPDSVISIGRSAFSGCSSLESIVLPFVGGVKTDTSDRYDSFGYIFGVNNYAGGAKTQQEYGTFYIPSTLKKVTITGGKVFSKAFINCNNLTSVVIGGSVTIIEAGAFKNCNGLTEITLPFVGKYDGAIRFEAVFGYIFGYQTSPIKSDISGATLQFVGGGYYYYFIPSSLQKVTITDSTRISEEAFYNCKNLTTIVISNNLGAIGEKAFFGCYNLKNVYITDIAAWCNIYGLSNLMGSNMHLYLNNELVRELIIPDGVTSIGSGAFGGCRSLASITIPNSVTSIGDYAFGYCDNLTSIVIPDSVTSIGNSVFYNCSNLTSVTIGNSVTNIGRFAFDSCSSLTSITIPNNVTSIGTSAFYGCNGLTEMILPFVGATKDGTENTHFGYIFGADSYSYNSSYVPISLKEVTITSATSIGSSAFSGCSSLTSIIIPNSVTSIGDSAFRGCRSLASITIPDSVTSIGISTFSCCSSLTNITIPNSVTSIGKSAFDSCSSLTSITIPNNVTSIGTSAFYGCNGLTEMILPFVGATKDGTENTHFGYIFGADSYSYNSSYVPRSLKAVTITSANLIGDWAFYFCASLTNVVIGGSVTSIGAKAFTECQSLTDVTIGENVTTIASKAFSSCSRLTSVYYKGTASDWTMISIETGNTNLTNVTLYYYSETEPTTADNYWHYDENGNIVVW